MNLMIRFFVKSNSGIDFQDLMPHRIHEILLVASPYDAFILEEDGHLTEQILTEYIGMNFTYAPRVNRVSTGQKAMELMLQKKFDLVINMIHGSPGEDGEFAKYLNKLNIQNNSLTPDIARLTQDKFNCNMKAKSIGINTPNNIKLKNNNDLKLIYDKIKFPCFVKPNSGGSSIGISKVTELKDLENAVNICLLYTSPSPRD